MTREELQKASGIIGRSKAIKDLLDVVLQVAPTDVTVLIQGESGVGKELFAKAIHLASKRADKQLISVNCGAIPEGLLESELFGHVKGSFTNAYSDRKGYFEIADGGTLFLDEIAEMPITTQVKFLRVLETKEFMPIGAEKVKRVDVRIIAAANKDLAKEVKAKRFRSDLYFRLKAVMLYIPPLRERREDIILLAETFLRDFSRRNNSKEIIIDHSGFNALVSYDWPGNVRELKNVVETAATLSKTGILTAEDFEPHFTRQSATVEPPQNLPVHLKRQSEDADRELIYRALIEIKKDLNELKILAKNSTQNVHETIGSNVEILPLKELERRAIKNALQQTQWNKRKAAKLLGINERTFYRKLKEYGIVK